MSEDPKSKGSSLRFPGLTVSGGSQKSGILSGLNVTQCTIIMMCLEDSTPEVSMGSFLRFPGLTVSGGSLKSGILPRFTVSQCKIKCDVSGGLI